VVQEGTMHAWLNLKVSSSPLISAPKHTIFSVDAAMHLG